MESMAIVIVAIITGVCSVIGQLIISIYTSNKTKGLNEYRLNIIEDKLDKHNHFMERIAVLEINQEGNCKDIDYIKSKL